MRRFFKIETAKSCHAALGSILSGLLDVLYPSLCEHCGERVEPGIPVCPPCADQIERVDPAELDSIVDRLDDPVITSLTSLWYFDRGNEIRRIQHQLKYGNRPSVGAWFGRMIGRRWLDLERNIPSTIIPIPLHRARLIERGFNQSEMIARGLAEVLHAPVDTSTIIRARATRSQTSLSRGRRQKNVEGAFQTANRGGLGDVLLVDDVLTTGATLNEAARALLEAGATRVDAATIGLART